MKTIFIFATLISGTVFAAENSAVTVPPNVSTTTKEATTSSDITKDLYGDFVTTYHGPTIKKFGPYSVNSRGRLDGAALSGFDSELTGAYMVDQDMERAMGLNVPFVAQPNIPGHQLDIGDVGIKAFEKKTIKTENLQLASVGYIQAPTSDASQKAHMIMALRAAPFAFYNIPSTKWVLGTWTDFKWLAGVDQGLSLKAWVGPFVSYRFSEKFLFNLMYETEADRFVGDRAFQFRNTLGDFQPGVIWMITKNMKLNPYLVLAPDNHLSTDTTGVGVVFFSRFM
jgi:hypothetical protein